MTDEKVEIDMEYVYERFFFAMLHNDLHELTNALFSILKCPVMVSDDIANNLSQSPDHYIGDKDWDALIETKSASSTIYYKFYKKYVKGSKHTEYPILINDGEAQRTTQLLSVLHKNGKFLGISAVLHKSKEVTDDERQVISLFNSAATTIISGSKFAGIRSRQLIMDMLTGAGEVMLDYPDVIKKLKMSYKAGYAILIGRSVSDQFDESVYKRVCNDISLCNQNVVATIEDGHIIIFCYDINEHNKGTLLAEIEERTNKFDVHFSVSDVFEDLNECRGYYKQAQLTFETGLCFDPKKRIYRYRDFAPRQVAVGFSEHYPSWLFIDPMVEKIKQYDRKNDSDYFETLKVYLMCMMNIKEASGRLAIHPNSMHYRIKRIAELFEIDFDDYDSMDTLMISMFLDDAMTSSDKRKVIK